MNTLKRYASGLVVVMLGGLIELLWYVFYMFRIHNMEDTGARDVGGYIFITLLLFIMIATAASGLKKHLYYMYFGLIVSGILLIVFFISLIGSFYFFSTPVGAILIGLGSYLAIQENKENPV